MRTTGRTKRAARPILPDFMRLRLYLFENTSKVFKSHRGVQKEILRLTKDDPRFDLELRAFLGCAYNFKVTADYQTGPASRVSAEAARDAIETACRFAECVAGLVSLDGREG